MKHRCSTRRTFAHKLLAFAGLLSAATFACAQGLTPQTPAQEYIHVNGHVFAVENYGKFDRVVVGYDVPTNGSNSLWALNTYQQPYLHSTTNQNWQRVTGPNLAQVSLAQLSVGHSDCAWGLDSSGNIYDWSPTSGVFTQVGGTLAQIAVGNDCDVWGVNGADSVYHYTGNTFNLVSGSLAQIAVGASNYVWGLNSSGNAYRWNGSSLAPVSAGATLAQISVGQDGDAWALTSAGAIYHCALNCSSFSSVSGALSQISVNSAGSVWGLNSSGNIYYYSSSSGWVQTSGTLSQIAAGKLVAYGLNGFDLMYGDANGGGWTTLSETLSWLGRFLVTGIWV